MLSRRRLILGSAGERAAARYIRKKGYVLLARNWRCTLGEIDLVVCRGAELVFCEVKTLAFRQESHFEAGDRVDREKQNKIKQLALIFCSLNKKTLRRMRLREQRFDVIGVKKQSWLRYSIDHREDAYG